MIRAHTPINSLYYRMDSEKRGYCLIFNMQNFDPKLDLEDRDGSDKDRDEISEFFYEHKFIVHCFDNLTKDQVKRELDSYALADHTKFDCLVVFFLSHGDHGFFYTHDSTISHSEFFDTFNAINCRTLAGKPKIFFIQACRGHAEDEGVTMVEQIDGPAMSYKLPVYADCFTMWSSVPGYISYRDPSYGANFIQTLLKVLRRCITSHDLAALHTIVNRSMNIALQTTTADGHGKTQAASLVSTGTHILHFYPPKPDDKSSA